MSGSTADTERLREEFRLAADRFDLANDAVRWVGYPSQEAHPANRLRCVLDEVWRKCARAGVDVSDIARRYMLGAPHGVKAVEA